MLNGMLSGIFFIDLPGNYNEANGVVSGKENSCGTITTVCEECNDGTGNSIYPYYGLAPHFHSDDSGFPVGTDFKSRFFWPSNFVEDPQLANHGEYTHCEKCKNLLLDKSNRNETDHVFLSMS